MQLNFFACLFFTNKNIVLSVSVYKYLLTRNLTLKLNATQQLIFKKLLLMIKQKQMENNLHFYKNKFCK